MWVKSHYAKSATAYGIFGSKKGKQMPNQNECKNDQVEARIQGIVDWIRAQKVVISQEEKVEITINMSGVKMQGKVTVYPRWGEKLS